MISWTVRSAFRHRTALAVIGSRGAWLAALWLLVDAACAIFDVRQSVQPDTQLLQLGGGLALCWLVVVTSSHRRLRWAAIALGTAHGTLGLLLWTVTGGGG